jgi:hypothetical protein
MPSPPDPVPVVLNPATTALLIFDVIDHICAHRPQCKEQMVPAIAALLARALSVIECFETDGGVNYRSDRLIIF